MLSWPLVKLYNHYKSGKDIACIFYLTIPFLCYSLLRLASQMSISNCLDIWISFRTLGDTTMFYKVVDMPSSGTANAKEACIDNQAWTAVLNVQRFHALSSCFLGCVPIYSFHLVVPIWPLFRWWFPILYIINMHCIVNVENHQYLLLECLRQIGFSQGSL